MSTSHADRAAALATARAMAVSTSTLMATTRQRIAVTDFGGGPTLLFVHVGGWSFICGICYSSSLTSTDA
jgi:hypothetical protein